MVSLIVLGILGYLLLGLATGVFYEIKIYKPSYYHDFPPATVAGLFWPITVVVVTICSVIMKSHEVAENLIDSIVDRLTKEK